MNITHLHGMCQSSFDRFINGEGKQSGPWSVSDRDNLTYMYSVAKHVGVYSDDTEEVIDMLENDAIESAILQCALQGEESLYVLFCNVDSGIIEDDFSCENMDGVADCIPQDSFRDSVVYIKKYYWNKFYSPFVINMQAQRQYFNLCNVDSKILKVSENISYDSDCFESCFEVEFQYQFNL